MVSGALCDALLAEINRQLNNAIDTLDPSKMTPNTGFGTILARKNRYDMYVRNEGLVEACLREILAGEHVDGDVIKRGGTPTATTSGSGGGGGGGGGEQVVDNKAGGGDGGGGGGAATECSAAGDAPTRSTSTWTLTQFFQQLFDGAADAKFSELSCIVSDAGAPRQPLHPDTHWEEVRWCTEGLESQCVAPRMCSAHIE